MPPTLPAASVMTGSLMPPSLVQIDSASQAHVSRRSSAGAYSTVVQDDDSLALADRTRRDIGLRLQIELARAGATQTDAAKVALVSKQAVNHWVKGRTLPQFAQLYRLAQRYQFSTDYVLFGRIISPEVIDLATRIASMPENARALLAEMFAHDPAPPPALSRAKSRS